MIFGRYVYKKSVLRFFAGVFDAVGSVIFFWLRIRPGPKKITKILLVRLDQLGDVVMTLPALQALKDFLPEADIDFLVSLPAASIVKAHPAVSRVYEFKDSYFSPGFSWKSALKEWLAFVKLFRKNRYDLAVDFRGDVRNVLMIFFSGIPRRIGRGITGGGFLLTDCLPETTGEHQIERNLACVRTLGLETKETFPKVYLPTCFRESFVAKFSDWVNVAERPWMVAQVGSGYPSKRWSIGNFAELFKAWLDETGGTVFLVGQRGEEELGQMILRREKRVMDLIGKTSLGELCALIESADVFVGNDSGPAHIAAALEKRTVVLFSGTNTHAVWEPRGSFVSVLFREVSCSPCHEKICPLPRHVCMEGVSVEKVLHCVKGMMR